MLHVALYQPIIPQNVGNIARTCVGMNAHLHVIGPTIVDLSDKAVRRAGLDYWDDLTLTEHANPEAFFAWADALKGATMYAVTKFAQTRFDEPAYRDGDILLFGSEREGLPPEVHARFKPEQKIAIPIPGAVRSYNLGNAVAIALAVATTNADLWPSDWAPKEGYTPPNTFTLDPG
ncbi:MAG: tRNA (cytidine(34)-2'-O)-methyltransferase [Phycisphaeraceae bacterium]